MPFSKVVVLKYEPRKLVPMKSQSAKEQFKNEQYLKCAARKEVLPNFELEKLVR